MLDVLSIGNRRRTNERKEASQHMDSARVRSVHGRLAMEAAARRSADRASAEFSSTTAVEVGTYEFLAHRYLGIR